MYKDHLLLVLMVVFTNICIDSMYIFSEIKTTGDGLNSGVSGVVKESFYVLLFGLVAFISIHH